MVESCNFKKRLELSPLDVINSKKQTVLEGLKNIFEGENRQTNTAIQATDLIIIFMITGLQQKWMKLKYRNICYYIQKQKAIEKKLGI